MPRYVALLRGINVGGSKKIPMEQLRELLSGLGFGEVRTLLQSGNAVFTAPRGKPEALAGRIERAIKEAFGHEVRCLVRTRDELQAVVEGNPLREVATDGSKLLVLFLSNAPDPKLLEAHDPRTLAPEAIRLGPRVVYQWCPQGLMAAPDLGRFVERHLKVTATGRNWNTVTRLAALSAE